MSVVSIILWLKNYWRYIAAIALVAALIWAFLTWKDSVYASGFSAGREAQKSIDDVAMKKVSDLATLAATEALKKQQDLEGQLSAVESKYYKEMTDADSENEKLRAAVVAGTQRLRIQARCPIPAGSDSVPGSAGGGGMDTDATVELSSTSRQIVFDLRAGILDDQAKLRACQASLKAVAPPRGN